LIENKRKYKYSLDLEVGNTNKKPVFIKETDITMKY